jgi:hypothetical protein
MELSMTPDPLPAALDQLAAHHEQIARLDRREADHFSAIAGQLSEMGNLVGGIGRIVQDHQATLAQLTNSRQPDQDADDQFADPAPKWWKLTAEQRREPLSRLHAWVEQVYRPGYGHLAATLGSCWEAHDLCLYGLDILAELWSVLYLQDRRSTALLSAQAEYQARILPGLAAQFMTETTGCSHARPANVRVRTAS